MVTPNSGGAVPRHTNIDIAIGGVWNAICKLIQPIIAAHKGSKPSFTKMGEKNKQRLTIFIMLDYISQNQIWSLFNKSHGWIIF